MAVSYDAYNNLNNSRSESQLTTNKHEKYFLGDRKTFMKELKDKIDQITLDLSDPDVESMIIDGELIDDKNSPGAIYVISRKLNELRDLNRTIISAFDFLKEMEEEVSRLIS